MWTRIDDEEVDYFEAACKNSLTIQRTDKDFLESLIKKWDQYIILDHPSADNLE